VSALRRTSRRRAELCNHCTSLSEYLAGAPARVGVYFDEAGVLTLVDGMAKLPPADTLQRAISVLRRTAPKLQEIVLDVSRLFGADYWRLDVFLSEMAPLHVNGLTYPAPSDDRRDLVRLANGYTRLSAQADPAPRVPATCALRAISRLLPEEVRYEALEGLLKTRMSQHAHDKACRGYRASYLAASSLESLAGGQY
jgi:hypothetical protein